MNEQEYNLIKNFSYGEYCEYLHLKYGEVNGPYFIIHELTPSELEKEKKERLDSIVSKRGVRCSVNKEVVRTDDGLFIHHIKEDRATNLSKVDTALRYPLGYQDGRNLVYCDYLEHLFLHVLLLENPITHFNRSDGSFIVGDLERLYSLEPNIKSWEHPAYRKIRYSQNVYKLIKDRYDKCVDDFSNPVTHNSNKEDLNEYKITLLDYFYPQYKNYLFRKNGKEQDVFYKITEFNFNPSDRMTSITFNKVTKYKKTKVVHSYETGSDSYINGKDELVTKTIKLTNQKLEKLPSSSDTDIAFLAPEIIRLLNYKSLVPSWYQKDELNNKRKDELCEIDEYINSYTNKLKVAPTLLNYYEGLLKGTEHDIEKTNEQYEKYKKKISNKVLIIFTLGIYKVYATNKMKFLKSLMNKSTSANIKYSSDIERIKKEVEKDKEQLPKYEDKRDKIINKYETQYEKIRSLV